LSSVVADVAGGPTEHMATVWDVFIYGRSGTSIEQINNTTGTTTYLHHDQAGSTRLLTGSTGTVTGKCTYGAYGAPTCEGASTTPLGYDGQYTSSDTGLIYMRARAYDPTTAQFLTRDPLVARTWAPYEYANDSPLSYYDPAGEEFFSVLSAVAGVGAAVSAAIPGADITAAPFLAGVSVGAGAIASGKTVAHGETGAAAADAAGAGLGAASLGFAAAGSGIHYGLEVAGVVVAFLGEEGDTGGSESGASSRGGNNGCGFGPGPGVGSGL
jgi:RHS repeat-associated protein